MKGQQQIDTYKSFDGKTEADVKAFLTGKNLHCVKCKKEFTGNEVFAYTIKNSLAIKLRNAHMVTFGVPAIVCQCGYENTLLKILAQV